MVWGFIRGLLLSLFMIGLPPEPPLGAISGLGFAGILLP
jgi:hypothetical protein